MLLIPWNTDAPIYHWPWATVGLMAANVMVFVRLISVDYAGAEEWVLSYGDGLHPLQWLTSNFIHGNFVHLLGNMIFLWAFGLVVEGKLGWWRFLAVFLGLGITQSGLEQLLTLGLDEGFSFGASAAIYGLMAMSLVWAPKNDLHCVGFFFFHMWELDLSIQVFALIYLGFEIVKTIFTGLEMTSAVLHLSGAILGFGLGTVMLKLDWVDCENWDLYSLWAGRNSRLPSEIRPEPAAEPIASPAQLEAQGFEASERIRTLVKDGHVAGALALYDKLAPRLPGWRLLEYDLLELIQAMHRENLWERSVPFMVQYLRLCPEKSVRMRLRLAQILVEQLGRPGQALRVLGKLPTEPLPDPLEKARKQLTARATKMQEDVGLELESEDW